MKAILLATIIAAMKAYVGGGLFTRIGELVSLLNGQDNLSGSEKMALVIAGARREAATLSETLIRAVAEILLLKLKGA
jgi:hypothetical protein